MKRSGVLKESKDSQRIKDYVAKVTMPIFNKTLQETPKNRMSVGRGSVSTKNKIDVSLYQPHNYRLYIDYSRTKFNPPEISKTDPKRSVVTTPYEYKIKNSTEHYFKNYHDCNITVKKTQIEIINKLEHKRWYVIKHGKVSDYEIQVRAILEKKDKECFTVLKRFIKEFGGESNLVILNRKSEDKIQLEDSIDLLGKKNHFHSKVSKKVYNEPNLEFKDPVFAVNYFENRAIEKIAPELSNEIKNIKDEVSIFKKSYEHDLNIFKNEALIPLTQQIKLHLKVQRKTLKVQDETLSTLKEIRKDSRQKKAKKLLQEWGW